MNDLAAGAEYEPTEINEEPDQVALTLIAEELAGDGEYEVPAMEHVDGAMSVYLRDVRKTKLLSAEEEQELAARIAKGDVSARNKMVESHLRLAVKEARRYTNRSLSLMDLIEEGNLALVKAVGKFDLSKGCRYSTYATWWVRRSIERAVINKGRAVRLPVHVSEEVRKMIGTTNKLASRLKREPSINEIAAEMGKDVVQVHNLMTFNEKIYSADLPMGEDGNYTLLNTIRDVSGVPAADLMENLNSYDLVSKGFATLSEIEKNVLVLHFGLYDKEPQTLNSIGQIYGVTRERVRQIESKALQKLRKCVEETDTL